MHIEWIVNQQSADLVLFFNGWGMDRRIVSHLQADSDVLMVYDYRDLTLPDSIGATLARYKAIDVLAWSMGVWAYAAVQDQFAGRVRRAVALNGTPRPIDNAYGIPAAVYDATVRQFSEPNRRKFFQRMCGTAENARWFAPHQPQRPLREQRDELAAIQQAAARHPDPASPAVFTCALIGQRDKIIPARHQVNYWQGAVRYRVIDSPHCAFRRWNSWKEIFDDVTTD